MWGTAVVAVVAMLGASLTATAAQALDETGTGGIFAAASGRVADGVALKANTWTSVTIAGQAGVPATGAGAVVLNATVSKMTGLGQLVGRPDASTSSTLMLTYDGGDLGTTSGSSTVAVGDDGTIQVEANTNSILYLDVEGYYTASGSGTAPGGFVPVSGARIVDTRNGTGVAKAAIKPGGSLTFQAGGVGGIPTNASGIVANFLTVNETADGYTTPYPTGGAKPQTSLHYPANAPTSDTAQVALSSSGQVTVANSGGTTDLVVDIEGYFTATGGAGAVYTPATGGVYDTRHTGQTAIPANGTRVISVAGVNGIPTMASGLTAVALSLTAIHAANSSGNATIWADGTTKPGTTAVNFTADSIRSNTVIVPVGSSGRLDLGNYGADSTDYQLELQGWYINPIAPTISCPSYTPGTWTTTLPTAPVSCTVHLPDTGDNDGVLDTSINGGDVTETALSSANATDVTVQVPAASSWYDIDASATYSGDVSGTSHFQFGLEDGAPSALIGAIQKANPTEFENVSTATTSSNGSVAVQTADSDTGSTGTVATTATAGVTVASDGTSTDIDTGASSGTPASVGLSLPAAGSASNAHVEQAGIVSYDNADGSSTVPIVKTDGSVQINTVIANANAPTQYAYPATIPTGSSLAVADDGSITVTDANGNWAGGISPAWAIDANGTAVPTHYVVNGTTITQDVDLSSTTIAYPVVADPWLGIALISKVKWVNYSKWSPTLAVTPTWYGRYGPIAAGWAAWSEITSKASKANTNSMNTQFFCHWDAVRVYAPNKPTWDLDSKRPNTSLTNEIRYKCNYPDGGREW